jgi:hypothetical protein
MDAVGSRLIHPVAVHRYISNSQGKDHSKKYADENRQPIDLKHWLYQPSLSLDPLTPYFAGSYTYP